MDTTPPDDTPSVQTPPANLAVDPPLVQPARPGPNVWVAIAWCLLLVVWNFALVTVGALVLVFMSMALIGRREFLAAMKGSDGTAIMDMPGAAIVIFLFATGSTLLLAGGIVTIMFRSNARRVLALRGASGVHLLLAALLAFPMVIVAGEVQGWAGKVLPHIERHEETFEKLGQEPWSIILLLGCLLPALGEEIFFRGFLGRGLLARHGVFLGALFTAILFGAAHLDPPQAVGVAVLAVAFQGVYLSSKSLLTPMLLHAVNNAIGFTLLRLGKSPVVQALLGPPDSSQVSPLLFAAALLAVAGIGWMFYETRCRWVLSDGRLWEPGYVTAEMPPEHLMAVPRIRSPRTAGVIVALAAYLPFVIVLALEIAGN